MQRKKYLVKNTALFALNSIGTRLITFLLVPIYTKAFDTSEYGGVDLVTTVATILVPIITINIGEAVMRFSLDENAERDKIVSVGTVFAALSVVLGTIVFAILMIFSQIQINPGIVYLYCVSQGLYQTSSCNLRGQEKLLQYAIGNIISTFSAAILNIIFLLVLRLGANGYFLAYILSFFIAAVYCSISGGLVYNSEKIQHRQATYEKYGKIFDRASPKFINVVDYEFIRPCYGDCNDWNCRKWSLCNII